MGRISSSHPAKKDFVVVTQVSTADAIDLSSLSRGLKLSRRCGTKILKDKEVARSTARDRKAAIFVPFFFERDEAFAATSTPA